MAINIDFDHQLEDEVFYMSDNKVTRGIIKFVQMLYNSDGVKITYSVYTAGKGGIIVSQTQLFKSKKDLIDSL
tara:strand:+ start:3495 stop:3713 length:219 start_codon:yes stop_codon:yes gene_type:complete